MTQTTQTTPALELFSRAFQNPVSKEFQKNALSWQFYHAILSHHSFGSNLSADLIKAKTSQLINLLFYQLSQKDFEKAAELFSSPFIFDEFSNAYGNFVNFRHPKKRQTFLSPYFYGQSLAFIGKEDPLLKHLILDSRPHFSQMSSISNTGTLKRHDSALITSFLHNMPDPKAMLNNISSSGFKRLFVEEEVLVSKEDQALPLPGINEIWVAALQSPFMKVFLQMSIEEQLQSCRIAEFIEELCMHADHNVAFLGQFNTIAYWVKLFTETGWRVDKIKFFGFSQDEFKPVCKALFILSNNLAAGV